MNSPPKLIQKIDDQNSISKRTMKTSQNQTIRKVADVTKRIDNVEYMLKIEDKNKKQLIERYEKQIQKTEKIIDKLEKELKVIIKELNEKEAKIYEIQKEKFDSFKEDISKFEHIYVELEEKNKDLLLQISELRVKERINYNHSNMLNEDCDSFRLQIALTKKKIAEYKETLVDVEKSYPKEFEFLLEDIKLEKELIEIKQQKSNIYIKSRTNCPGNR